MTTPFSGPGVYVTVGGYLVEFNTNTSTKKEFSPGTNRYGQTIHEAGLGHGWTWHEDGTLSLDGPWSAKLRLSQKLDFPSIPAPPQGYRYKDGYPKLVKVPAGQECMTPQGMLVQFIFDTDGEYIPLEKIEPKYYECDSPDPNYVIREGDQYFYCDEWHDCGGYGSCIGKTVGYAFKPILKMRSLSPFPKPSIVNGAADKDTHHFIVEQEEPVWYTVTNPDYVLTEGDQYQHVDDRERWYSIITSIGKTPQQAKLNSSFWRCRSKNKEACLSSAPKETPDINFNLEKATDLTATLVKPSLLKRSFNYWVIEPASNAFRYVVITAVLWGGVEVYKNPAVVWKFLPKISITMN